MCVFPFVHSVACFFFFSFVLLYSSKCMYYRCRLSVRDDYFFVVVAFPGIAIAVTEIVGTPPPCRHSDRNINNAVTHFQYSFLTYSGLACCCEPRKAQKEHHTHAIGEWCARRIANISNVMGHLAAMPKI